MPAPKTLIKQGAEAHLYQTHFLLPTLPCLLKHRPSKPYRHPLLDQRLTKHRVLSESRLLIRLSRDQDRTPFGVTVPEVYFVDEVRGEIYMEWIEGRTVRDVLKGLLEAYFNPVEEAEEEGEGGVSVGKMEREREREEVRREIFETMRQVGIAVGRMHALDVVHGDLTTSNLMVRAGDFPLLPPPASSQSPQETQETQTPPTAAGTKIIVIDFGLGGVSTSEEDKAVDLYVLERAFISTHPKAEAWFAEEVLGPYEKAWAEADKEGGGGLKAKGVLRRLKDVRRRGRKKSMIG